MAWATLIFMNHFLPRFISDGHRMLKAVVTLLAAAATVKSLPADTAPENVVLQARQPSGAGGYPNVDLKQWHDQFDKSGNAVVPPEEAKKPQVSSFARKASTLLSQLTSIIDLRSSTIQHRTQAMGPSA